MRIPTSLAHTSTGDLRAIVDGKKMIPFGQVKEWAAFAATVAIGQRQNASPAPDHNDEIQEKVMSDDVLIRLA
jgi:hypothetical protein